MSQQVTKQAPKKQINETVILGDQPQMAKCPYCLNQTVSNVSFKNGYLSYVAGFLVLLAVGLLPSMLLIPLVMVATKQLIHRCAVCGEEIGTDGKIFHIMKIQDKMMSFKLGEMGCIITRKILIGLVLLLLTIGLLAYRIHTLPENALQGFHNHQEPIILITDTWDDFRSKCSREQYLLQDQSRMFCQRHYQDRTIQNWKGYVIRIEDYRFSLLKYLHHAVTILVRMEPPESDFNPDIVLTMDSAIAEKLGNIIEQLNRGGEFSFDAIIKNLGDQATTKHFHLINIKKEDGYKEIPPHLHDHGRYESQGFLNSGSS